MDVQQAEALHDERRLQLVTLRAQSCGDATNEPVGLMFMK